MVESIIRAVLFDFGGVIAQEGFYNALISLAEEQGIDSQALAEEGMNAVYDCGFVLGQAAATDFWSLLRKRTGLQGSDNVLTRRVIDGFLIRPRMIELVQHLHAKGYVTGILSDQTHWLDELDKKDHFYNEFDHIYNSYYLGKGKRDPSLFTDVVNDLKLRADKVLFVDDNETNIQRAKQKGLRVIHYRSYEQFVSDLEHLLGDDFTQIE